MTALLTFEYCSVHGALAAAYCSGALAAEFGPEHVRVALRRDAAERSWGEPLIAESPLADALQTRPDTRLLGVVPDGEGPAWALTTTHVNLERQSALLVRALSAVLQARPHRRPMLASAEVADYAGWLAEAPLRAATILLMEDFVHGGIPLAA